jgi:purine-cytosine permease-like protein
LVNVFPGWFVVPYLIIAIFQLFAINSVDLYSSGVTLQSLGIHLKRYHCVMIDTVVSGGFAAYVIFSQHFSQLLSDFLLFVIVWVAPWCAIYLVDYFLRRGRYDTQALQNEKGGIYFRNAGWNWRALVALGIGMVAAALWLNAYSPYVSPLSSRVGGSDFSIFMGLVFGGLSYYLLARKSVVAETVETPAPPE